MITGEVVRLTTCLSFLKNCLIIYPVHSLFRGIRSPLFLQQDPSFFQQRKGENKTASLVSYGNVALVQSNDYEPPEIQQASPAAAKDSPANTKKLSKTVPSKRVTRQSEKKAKAEEDEEAEESADEDDDDEEDSAFEDGAAAEETPKSAVKKRPSYDKNEKGKDSRERRPQILSVWPRNSN